MNARLTVILLVIAFLLMFTLTFTYLFMTTPITPGKPIQVDIVPGRSAWEISKTLEKYGVITDASMFMTLSIIMGKATHLQAGAYVFEGNHFPLEVINILFKGKTLRYRITIPEGANIYQIGEIIASTGLLTKQQFIQSTINNEIMAFLKIDAPSMEGYLYPDTYFLTFHMTPLEIMAKMLDRFNRIYTAEMEQRAKKLGLSKLEVVTLASIIEKEAVVPTEKPMISSVFHNRMACGMRLQSDPTAIYGIEGFKGKIGPDELLRDSPYNTYRHRGLPPGPICNPSVQSIIAALWPAKTNYLYFVSRGDGTHSFSSSLTEHNRAISKNFKHEKLIEFPKVKRADLR
jgi:UPF0755 protein